MTQTPVREMAKHERKLREEELTWKLSGVQPRVQCAVRSRQWQQTEYWIREAFREKRTQDARLHARDLTPICGHCPVADMCREWALVSRYSGVAGGHLVLHGRPLKAR